MEKQKKTVRIKTIMKNLAPHPWASVYGLLKCHLDNQPYFIYTEEEKEDIKNFLRVLENRYGKQELLKIFIERYHTHNI